MGYRVIFLANSSKLSVKNEQLVIDNGEVTRVPLEDIECILSDTPQTNLNTYLLMKMAEYGITFYVTDKSHHPCGVVLPICKHSRHMAVLSSQISMTLPAKKQLWKQIITQKIINQATVLQLCGIDNTYLMNLSAKVKSGDTTNVEAVAAAAYFKALFGEDFTRAQENLINACLNYGYAIIRSTIEKYLIVYGYEPSLGLFHKSTLNSFNLADDLIEPYRPVIDLFVKQNVRLSGEEFTTLLKAKILNLLTNDVVIDNRVFALAKAIDNTVASLTGYIGKRRNDLALPSVLDLQQHQYE